MPTASKIAIIRSRSGLHARPAMAFVDLANQFRSSVRVEAVGGEYGEADGKSIMKMMQLAAVEGTALRITADGDDADEAVNQLVALVEKISAEEESRGG